MKKQPRLVITVFLVLIGLALILAQQAVHRGDLMAAVVMMAVAVIFWQGIRRIRNSKRS
jgi:dipeptide/tripeptide permease